MRDTQVVVPRSIAGINREELCLRVVRCSWTLIAFARLVGRRRRDERDPALGQLRVQRMEWHLDVVSPFVWRAIAQRLVVVPDTQQVRNRRIMRRGKAVMSRAYAGHGRLLDIDLNSRDCVSSARAAEPGLESVLSIDKKHDVEASMRGSPRI